MVWEFLHNVQPEFVLCGGNYLLGFRENLRIDRISSSTQACQHRACLQNLQGHEHCLYCSAMLDTLRPHLHELLADSRPDRGGAGAWGLTLRRLFQLPLHRLKDYVRILTKIAAKYPPVSFRVDHTDVQKLFCIRNCLVRSASVL